jgi:uncharacterized protein YutE (UPF0331/DUF86 family)
MTPGDIDLKVVSNRLDLVDRYLDYLKSVPQANFEEFTSDPRNPGAAESFIRRSIEGLLDTARHLLAKAHGLGALEYRQVARLAAEKGLIRDAKLARTFEELAGYRIRLTHHYEEVTDRELFDILRDHLQDIPALREELRQAASRLAAPE